MRNQSRYHFINNLRNESEFFDVYRIEEALELGLVVAPDDFKWHSGVMIGLDGFGFERNADGKLIKFPHFGKVIIGKDVEIQGPTTITRGSLKDTLIGDGTKIAGNCQIGHNSQIGNHCIIGPHVTVGGSAIIENFVNIWCYSMIDHGVKVESYSEVGGFSYVKSNIPTGQLWYGIPAKCVKEKWSTV